MYDVLLSIYKINLIKKYINDMCDNNHFVPPSRNLKNIIQLIRARSYPLYINLFDYVRKQLNYGKLKKNIFCTMPDIL